MDRDDRRPRPRRGYKLLPDFSYEPWIFDKDCTVLAKSPFTVDCTIRPEAKWSDGVAITADDFRFTFDTIMNEKNNVVTRNGYDKILEFNVISPTEFQMVFKEIFTPYRELWASTSTVVLPKHVLEGTDFNKVWNTCICDPKTKKPIASGPMLVQSFKPDQQITLVPNPNYWGNKASVSKVVFIPITDSNSEINAFRAGEVDMIYPQNQIGLRKRIEAADDAKYTSSLGPQWEHFDMLTIGAGSRRHRGAQGDRHRDASPADRRPGGEGRQRRCRRPRQHDVDDESAAVRGQLVDVPEQG